MDFTLRKCNFYHLLNWKSNIRKFFLNSVGLFRRNNTRGSDVHIFFVHKSGNYLSLQLSRAFFRCLSKNQDIEIRLFFISRRSIKQIV